jgi:dihydroflavonol-4-reductase
MKVLVTGASGFIGGWLCQYLLKNKFEVYALCRSEKFFPTFKAKGIFPILGDVTKPESLATATKNMDWVFHLAGIIDYKEEARQLMEEVNVEGTKNIIKACIENNVKKFLLLSSVVTIGSNFNKSDDPMNEESNFNLSKLNLGYFETKRKAESIVLEAAKQNKIWAVAVNPSTVYGAGDMLKGSRKFQRKVADGSFPFYTPGGVSIVHVKDVVAACLNAMEMGRSGERYILSGENITIKQLFNQISIEANVSQPKWLIPKFILKALSYSLPILKKLGFSVSMSKENTLVSIMYHWFDNRKAKKELNFSPMNYKLAIKDSVQWYLNNKDKF